MPKHFAIGLLLLLSGISLSGRCEDWLYTVRTGDNLWNLSERYLIHINDWSRLQALNHIRDPWHIPPGTQLRIPVSWLQKHPTLARVRNLDGAAELSEEGGRAALLRAGELLVPGDTIRTGPASNVTLEFMDGTLLLLQPDSSLILRNLETFRNTEMTDIRLHLDRGRAETRVAPAGGTARRFEIITPAAVTSVRGTDYRVGSDRSRPRTLAEVIGGRVAVTGTGKTRMVPGGYGTVTETGVPPEPPIPLLPAPDLTKIARIFDRIPLELHLPPLPGAHGYRLQVASDRTFDRVLFDRMFTKDHLRGPDLPDGDYWLRVRASDSRGLEGLNADRMFTLNARPEPPFAIEPKPGAGVPEATPRFVWSRDASIQAYHLQVARDAAFTRIVADLARLSDTDVTLDRKLGLGRYYWRVASVDAREGQGPFSDPQDFRRVMPAPEIEEPEIEDDFLFVRWRAGLPGQRYQFQFAEDSSFSKLLVDNIADQPQQRLERPDAGEYFMRIRTIDPDGFVGPYGKTQTLDVPPRGLYWLLLALPLFALFAL